MADPIAASLGCLGWSIAGAALLIAAFGWVRARRAVAAAEQRAGEHAQARERAELRMRIIGHEVRTPLSVLYTYLHVISERRARGEDFDDEYLRRMERAVLRTQRVVGDLLEGAGATSSDPALLAVRLARCDLRELCRQAAEEQEGRTIETRLPGGPVWIKADAGRIAQVLANLLGNALAYSPQDRPVALSLEEQQGQAVVAVRDEGRGIPPEERERIFERGHRVPGTPGPGAGAGAGLGLGLHVCRALIERHGGRIWVESGAGGPGSTFLVALPLARMDAGTPADVR